MQRWSQLCALLCFLSLLPGCVTLVASSEWESLAPESVRADLVAFAHAYANSAGYRFGRGGGEDSAESLIERVSEAAAWDIVKSPRGKQHGKYIEAYVNYTKWIDGMIQEALKTLPLG